MRRTQGFRKHRCWLGAALLAGMFGLVPTPGCYAQVIGGAQVGGRVSDPSGASVPRAQVKIRQTSTELVRTAATDDQGGYVFPNLPVGPYQLEVTASGFRTYVQAGIVLQVGNDVQINVVMRVGSLTENVEVTAGAEMVETRDTSISQVIDQARIVELPLNGRQPTDLILLAGAAITAPAGDLSGSKNYPSSVTISVAGGQADGLNYLLDGASHVDAYTNVNLPIPFPDSLQEFSVQTSSVSAQYGMHPGGVVNAVTKSGTNEWHGDLFEFLRNGDVNARNFFAATHDTLRRNQYGGTIGGPVWIPKVWNGKNKLFFFGGFQGTRNRSTPPQSISFVPTQAVLNGDFSTIDSGACVSGGKGRTLKDPTTGQPFPNDQIPVSRFNGPALLMATKYLPLATNQCGQVTYGVPTTGDEEQVSARVDWLKSAKHTLFARYYLANYRNPAEFTNNNLLMTSRAGNLERVQTATINDTYSFSPRTVNSLHLSAIRRRDDRIPPGNGINLGTLGVNVYVPWPHSLYVTVSNYFTVGCGSCGYSFFNVNSFQGGDDVNLIRGKHQIAFGVDAFRHQHNSDIASQSVGSVSINGQFTGDGLADYMLGLTSGFTQRSDIWRALRQVIFQAYIQDSIKMSPRLTVNVGMRWEPMIPEHDRYGEGTSFSMAGFLAGQRSTVYTNAPVGVYFYGDPGIPKAMSYNHLNDWAPRAGIAWDPRGDGRQSIRASGAIVFDTQQIYGFSEANPPFAPSVTVNSPVGGFTNPWLGYPGGSPYPWPSPVAHNIIFPIGGAFGEGDLPLNLQPTYAAEWNVSYQRQVTADWLATISYVGNKTTHVWIDGHPNPAVYIPGNCVAGQYGLTAPGACSTTGNTNQRRVLYLLNPTEGQYYGGIGITDQGAIANYNGMLLSLQHRLSHDVTVLANYTWSHAISDGDYSGVESGTLNQNPYSRSADRDSAGFDCRHLFNFSLIAFSPATRKGGIGAVLRGWQLSPIITIRSGMPIRVVTGVDNSLTGQGNDRPNLILPDAYASSLGPALQYLNPQAFQANALGTFGNLGKAAVTGPSLFVANIALSRIFAVAERMKLEARFEAFNATNHVNFSNPTLTLTSSTFGRILGAGDPRILQFALKLRF